MKNSPRAYEYSYETITTIPISNDEYDLCIILPQSKKYLAYITTSICGNSPYLIIYELNRYRKISDVLFFAQSHPTFKEIVRFSGEIILYGSMVEQFFVVEDILIFKNNKCHNAIFKEKMQYMILAISLSRCFTPYQYIFTLPFMFSNTEEDMKNWKEKVPYPIHSIQYRSLYFIKPVINLKEKLPMTQKPVAAIAEKRQSSSTLFLCKFIPHYSKPQYKKTAIFQVRADMQYDIYKLYCYNSGELLLKYTFVDFAHIPDYPTSKFMNSIFRTIRENRNLDLIEESDDEDDFENIEDDKYVFLEKKVNMICKFHPKFKKWVPVEIVDDNCKIVSASLL